MKISCAPSSLRWRSTIFLHHHAALLHKDLKCKAPLIDPNAVKNERLQQTDESILFKSLAMEWMEDRKAVIKETTYLRDLSVFEKDLFPALGQMPIDQIKGKDVLTCAKKIEERGAQEMAKRSIPLAGRIFRFAIRKGIIENDPTPHL